MRPLEAHDPRSIGSYSIAGVLGQGGMGKVYLGQSYTGKRVAIKVIRSEIANDPVFRQRFAREVDAGRAISALYTAPIVDADPHAETPWFATTYIEGPSVEDEVAASGPMSVSSVLILAAGLAEAFIAIHRAGLVHRDLKPSNVLLTKDGPCVIDFGIALVPDTTSLTQGVIGTPAYMSPEHIAGEEVGPPSDIFSIGATLAFAATGVGPLGQGTPHSLIARLIAGQLDTSAVPERLKPIVARCLARNVQYRPTATELLSLLAAAGATHPYPGWYSPTAAPQPVSSAPASSPPLPASAPPFPASAPPLPAAPLPASAAPLPSPQVPPGPARGTARPQPAAQPQGSAQPQWGSGQPPAQAPGVAQGQPWPSPQAQPHAPGSAQAPQSAPPWPSAQPQAPSPQPRPAAQPQPNVPGPAQAPQSAPPWPAQPQPGSAQAPQSAPPWPSAQAPSPQQAQPGSAQAPQSAPPWPSSQPQASPQAHGAGQPRANPPAQAQQSAPPWPSAQPQAPAQPHRPAPGAQAQPGQGSRASWPLSAAPAQPVYAPAQQQYPAGAYPTPGYPGYPAPYGQAPQNPSRRGLWIALGIVALLLVGGGITATVVLVGTNNTPLAGPSASTGPTTAVTTPPAITKLTLNAPQNLAGLTKSTEASLQQTADNLVNEIKAEIDGETGAVASFYNDPQAPGKRVLFVGVTADIVSPTAEIDQSFVSLNETGLNIKDIADVSPGPLGGKAKCGQGKTGDVGLAVCIWADNESLGMVVFYNRTVAESTALFVKIRGEASTRS